MLCRVKERSYLKLWIERAKLVQPYVITSPPSTTASIPDEHRIHACCGKRENLGDVRSFACLQFPGMHRFEMYHTLCVEILSSVLPIISLVWLAQCPCANRINVEAAELLDPIAATLGIARIAWDTPVGPHYLLMVSAIKQQAS